MASSKVVTTSPDLPRQSSACSLSTLIGDLQQTETSKNSLGSVNMDDFMKSFFPPSETNPTLSGSDPNLNSGSSNGGGGGGKTLEEVWKEIVVGGDQRLVVTEEAGTEQMTLEDFLTKAGAVREDDVKGAGSAVIRPVSYEVSSAATALAATSGGRFAVIPAPARTPAPALEGASLVGFGNGTDKSGAGVGRVRVKRRAVQEPVDKATELKQRRMIKNRESAARSRERKQAYTVELECLITQLEEENARLMRQEAEQNKLRLKQQLMENLVTVSEKPDPLGKLRRVNSTEW